MRFNLLTQPSPHARDARAVPLKLTLRPSCGVPGEYTYSTDSTVLQHLLEGGTDLPSAVVKRFMGDVHCSAPARLLGVSLNDDTLERIGYFVD